ncbi:Holliday junction branch migration DNA helicase RuvB [Mycoplasmopsis felis]|uniref:Holliday junction branch migration DNA helicase RuvB n=1 Tax=Mycoplasmopsis felis TaxID=33923 RepID=UPI002AFE9EA4|nr:Holliday junction branch migration DNA helicase RuvB [Mycoplasmopsis felis]WQQ07515.1 Holliday junction branch migration DNA helicase RuvB [Mycoplasmopsis felis]
MEKLELRPRNFNDFIGQNHLKETLKTIIDSSVKQNKELPHMLFYGPPGMGKTTLASIISNASGNQIHYVQGSNIEKKSDLISMLSVLNENEILFIDEIHSVNKNIVEFIYNAMEDFVFDLIIGVEGNSKSMRMKIKPFTLIGATTKINEISQPLKDRFGYIGRIINYNEDDILKILINTSKKLKLDIDKDILKIIIDYSRLTPRIANNIIQRVNDFAISKNNGIIDKKIIEKTMKSMEIYRYGLTNEHIQYLKILRDGFSERPASLNTISSLTLGEKNDILIEIEPILLFLKLIEKNSRGRKITSKGINYLIEQNLIR